MELHLLCSQLIPENPKLWPIRSLSSRPWHGKSAFGNKFYGLSLIRIADKKKLAGKCRYSEFHDVSPSPAAAGVGGLAPKVFVGHSIYKGKAALAVEPRAPDFSPLDTGAFKLAKEGFVLLQFAPASGVRQYDWSRKQVFTLSVTEIGTLVSLGARDSCEFFHDPNKGRSEEGKVRKVLKVEPLPDGSGYLFNLSVQNKLLNVDESIYIPVSRAEYTVLLSAFNYILPYLMGWNVFANSIKPDDTSSMNNSNPRRGGDFEWSR